MLRKITLILALAFALARADYHYASHTGSNTYPYATWETAADSIQKVVDVTNPHDTVFVGSGHWWEAVAVQPDDSIAFIGMGMDSTICHYDSLHGMIFVLDNGCSIEGFTLRDARYGAGVEIRTYAGGLVSVKSCKFIKDMDGVSGSGFPYVEISDCIFDSCGIPIVEWVWIGNFYIANNIILNSTETWDIFLQVESALVEKNIIINNPNNFNGMCSICGAPYYAVIRNNVVANTLHGIGSADYKYNNILMNFNQGQGASGISAGNNAVIFNNIISNCYNGVAIVTDGEHQVNYNSFWNNTISIRQYGYQFDSVGNIFSDPMMVNPDSRDYHLQAYSPLIDAGDPSVLDPDSSRSDIGLYGGPFGDTYPYRDLPPRTPDSLNYSISADSLIIFWKQNTEADFWRYMVNRDTVSGFTPWAGNIVSEPETSLFIDINWDRLHNYYYRIAAYDRQGHLSSYSSELVVRNVGIFGEPNYLPITTYIESNYPNPFNAATTIVYYVADLGPIPAQIDIAIYDITGRQIRTLLKSSEEVGEHRVVWDCRDDSGHDLPSGVYFAKISQWGVSFLNYPRKLILIR